MDLLHPLNDFYAQGGLTLPEARPLRGEEVPEPYRQLLVHDGDMTPTLEAFHGELIHLRVLSRRVEGDLLCREVVLTLDDSERPVEFGAIRIYLQRFLPAARAAILECKTPLGTILRVHTVAHRSRPRAFFCIAPHERMKTSLQLDGTEALYGRRNVLSDAEDRALADIVEILPPLARPASGSGTNL